ncbi:UDP-N-acetylmuramoylalanine--D-glutamate ligase [Pseudonocardia autotrophica]|uniref:UDP-N-acetylmuramoylalanine--D-glutamate ligase n=2 Tax=Pseudonocardia TaxID=1847 RepID=A0A1Y2MQ29_PSEAH|nr:UDP-N-acetylmuramoylalanine--D-glutamate ligase [Pseudonocardia autotrophica]TDN72378.1 UDP-N-acetylmuramoylalanine--D-glutamate ligase [Pseudonocardia autotrophica]BBG03086.1 UDP-N-acetylmuramoylalanine--D-glutamate ligase [Pseudonocardia autotrophica]GEC23706.1 UDP-N-acetylmuramoylalanine--D-glutamate ligase [Pseudonocardia saturnea]
MLVAGAGISGLAAAVALRDAGTPVFVSDDRPSALAELPDGVRAWTGTGLPDGVTTVVTSPGRRPDHPLVAEAAAAGAEVIGEPELAWRLGALGGKPPAWLVITGTNGKTTTTEMLAAILQGAGLDSVACGNIGYPVVSAVAAGHEVLAVELSSFQLHWSPSVRPLAGVVLNVADDHLDWHGGADGYAAAKAAALVGDVAVAGVDDPVAARLLAAAPAPRRIGVTLGEPGPDQLGVSGGMLVDRAFGGGELVAADAVVPPGPPGITDALAAAALARAYGVAAERIGTVLTSFTPGPHRSAPAGAHAGVDYLDDSKATNPHAAAAALAAIGARRPDARVVWVVGGLLKGVAPDALGELAAAHATQLAGIVVIGTDRAPIVETLARHTPDLPVAEVQQGHDGAMVPSDQQNPMPEAVRRAASIARPGDVVLLAPAAASMDQFRDYAHRGDAFAAAVAALDGGR